MITKPVIKPSRKKTLALLEDFFGSVKWKTIQIEVGVITTLGVSDRWIVMRGEEKVRVKKRSRKK